MNKRSSERAKNCRIFGTSTDEPKSTQRQNDSRESTKTRGEHKIILLRDKYMMKASLDMSLLRK